MMETEGARILFWRSLKLGFRYTTMVADGDSKAYDTVQEDQPYGPEYLILKEECINHVSKRLGAVLRNLTTDCSKRGLIIFVLNCYVSYSTSIGHIIICKKQETHVDCLRLTDKNS